MPVAIQNRFLPFFGILISIIFFSGCPDSNGNGPPPNGENGARTCLRAEDCLPGEICDGGLCAEGGSSECMRDQDCPEGMRCDVVSATCVELTNGTNGPGEICVPGNAHCADSLTLEICNEDGSGWDTETCEIECIHGGCAICSPGESVCDGDISRVCNQYGTEWIVQDCGELDVECIDGVCQVCTPGEQRCIDDYSFEICNASGSGWNDYACLEGECDEERGECVGCTPGRYSCTGTNRILCDEDGETWLIIEDCSDTGGDCLGGRCVDLCSLAETNNSYIGCEYWPVVLSNTLLNSVFHSDFAVVVGNPSDELDAEVNVYRHGDPDPLETKIIPPSGLEVIRLPWNAMPASQQSGGNERSVTQKGRIAYRLQSSIPVTAYQFNPLRSKIGSTYSYTNDASLLLPRHVFGIASRYLALALPHKRVGNHDSPSFIAIVATEDDTTVTIRMRGYTASGGGVNELNPGTQTSVTLNSHEVLQLASRAGGGNVQASGSYTQYNDSDLSGSIIESDKPIAVYTGADCRYVPFNMLACDHIEQQLYPFHNWGSSYVGAVTEMPRGGRTNAGNVFRIVAGVDNTQLRFTPQSVHQNTVLNAGERLEFQTASHFLVETQGPEKPILMGQWLLGQDAYGSCGLMPCAEVGDPSMILNVPTQQFRTDYHFTTVDTISDNFINVIRRGAVQVNLNDQPLTGCWVPISGTTYQICRKSLPGGNHRISSLESAGVVVYGYDRYVSYGYPAGLDLQLIATPDPGW